MSTPSTLLDHPADPSIGLSPRRERLWGLIGGVVGSLIGVLGFLVAWGIPGVTLSDLIRNTYPPFFARREMIALDYYFLFLLLAGLGFLAATLVAVRTGRYPRSDGYGAALLGAILSALGGFVLFVRVWAMAHG